MPLRRILASLGLAAWLAVPGAVAAPAEAEGKTAQGSDLFKCEMTFSLRGWSAFYKTAKGEGTIECDNGQRAEVEIRTKGGGITFGKSEILDGTGKFSDVRDIKEIFGAYVAAGAHAGVVKSSGAMVMTKGEISLALAGTGRGVDLGVDFGKFTISRK